jgi:RibD C-terminal domain
VRRLRYQVATSLDGYIAGPSGEFDWIVMEPDIDFAAVFEQFDTAVMGRKTFLATLQQGGSGAMPGIEVVVFSRTLRPEDYPEVAIVNSDPAESVRTTVLLGEGIPMLPSPGLRTKLSLRGHRLYEKSGIVLLEYAVNR